MHEDLRNNVFFQHPMNLLMLEGSPLSVYLPQELAMKYIQQAKSGELPTEEQVEAVRSGVIDFCKRFHGEDAEAFQRDVDGIGETWPEMHDRFAKSLGLTQLMLDYGVNSRYFYQYLYITGHKFYGLALVAKDGYAVSVAAGKMSVPVLEKVPEGDWMLVVCVEEPSHPGRRFTDGAVQSILRKAKRIFDGGAGLASAYWNYGYPLGQLGQEIVLCDNDERLLGYLPLVFGRSLEDLARIGVKVVISDLMDEMARSEYAGKFDVVRLTGLLSYFPDPTDKRKIIRLALKMLAPGGVILVDEWVMGMSLARTALTQLWPIDPKDPHRLDPAPNSATAIVSMGAICKELGVSQYLYLGDYCNGNPVCWTQQHATPKCVLFVIGDDVEAGMLDMIPGSPLPGIV